MNISYRLNEPDVYAQAHDCVYRPCPPIRALAIEEQGWAPGHCVSTALYTKMYMKI